MSLDLGRELKRKAFHCLSLVYLAAYALLGAGPTLWLLGGWLALVTGVELARLRHPPLNDWLIAFFGGIHRPGEVGRVSGIVWTSLGCWVTIAAFGDRPGIVTAAILYLAVGDGVAALVGKAVGRFAFELGGRRKTVEGTLACLAACLACGWAAGLELPALLGGAVAATLVELVPTPLDDNLWLPVLSACALRALGAR